MKSVILLIFAAGLPARADICDPQKAPSYQASARDILRAAELGRMQENPQQFCDDELAKRFLFSKSMMTQKPKATAEEYETAARDGSLPQLLDEKIAIERQTPQNKWVLSLIPSEKTRAAAMDLIEFDNGTGRKRKITMRQARELLEGPRCGFKPWRQTSDVQKDPLQTAEGVGISGKSLATKYACYELLGIASALRCDSSLAVMEKISTPDDHGLVGRDLYRRVLADSRYDEGLRQAALKISNRAVEEDSSGSYFDDLKSSFLDAGADEKEAEEMTWNTVGMLASSGPNLEMRLNRFPGGREQTQKRLALATIASSLPILDHRSSREGHIYSFPPEVKGSCNTGKPYHFWYAAYLSRRAALETNQPDGAAASAFQAQKFYQLTQRGDVRGILSDKTYSPTNEVIRADLAYASNGALYGANRAGNRTPQTLDTDQSLRTLLSKADEGSAGLPVKALKTVVSSERVNAYSQWTERFDANSAFAESMKVGFPASVDPEYLQYSTRTPKTAPCP